MGVEKAESVVVVVVEEEVEAAMRKKERGCGYASTRVDGRRTTMT
jgi:hypothetical protein